MNPPAASEPGIRELTLMLWSERWLIVSITMGCVLASALGGIFNTKMYRATVQFTVHTDDGAGFGGLGSLVSQFGSIGSLASAAISGGNQVSEPVAVLESRFLTQEFMKTHEVLPVLYAKLWDAETGTWRVDDPEDTPTPWKAGQDFNKIRRVLHDTQTGLYTLTITWKDPELAARWANDLVRDTNALLRSRALRESERNIAYLRDQAARTEIVQVKASMYELIENEVKKAMLAEGRDDYALKVIDPADVPERSSSPRMLVWLLAGGVAGGLLSVLVVFLRAAWRGT